MIPVLLILIPLVTGLVSFLLKQPGTAKNWAVVSSLVTLAVAVTGIFFLPANALAFDATWLPDLGSRFTLLTDGMGKMLCLLTAISFPVIFLATYKNEYSNAHNFYFDNFYKPQPGVSKEDREKTNYDVPGALDIDLFLKK